MGAHLQPELYKHVYNISPISKLDAASTSLKSILKAKWCRDARVIGCKHCQKSFRARFSRGVAVQAPRVYSLGWGARMTTHDTLTQALTLSHGTGISAARMSSLMYLYTTASYLPPKTC